MPTLHQFKLPDGAMCEALCCGHGPRPLIFVPGGGDGLLTPSQGPRRLWRWLDGPRAHHFRIVYLSRRSPLAGASLDQQADDFAWVLKQLHWPHASLVEAQSAGGGLGVRLATRHPEWVGALALSSCAGWLDEPSRRRVDEWIRAIEAGEWEAFFHGAFDALWTPERSVLLRSFGALLLGLITPHDTARMLCLLHELRDLDMCQELGTLTQPVLVTGGSDDRIFPLPLQQHMAACIPHATSVWHDHFGHGNDFENPAHARLIAALGRMHIARQDTRAIVA